MINILDATLPGNAHWFNRLNAKLNPICHLLALLEAHHILHVSGVRVNDITTIYLNIYIRFGIFLNNLL